MSGSPLDSYLAAVRDAYRLAKGGEAAKLRGRRVRTFDERGVHPFSEAWGKVALMRGHPEVEPLLANDDDGAGDLLDVSPLRIQQASRVDAMREFLADAKEGALDELAEGGQWLGLG